jgi:hypothetical protein
MRASSPSGRRPRRLAAAAAALALGTTAFLPVGLLSEQDRFSCRLATAD